MLKLFIPIGPLIKNIWTNMNNASRGLAYRKVKMFSAVSLEIINFYQS